MAAGYRDAYQIFLMLSRGLTLRGQIFKMSVKMSQGYTNTGRI